MSLLWKLILLLIKFIKAYETEIIKNKRNFVYLESK